jgi:lipoprotein-releasing system ATP-binding protein
MIRVTDLRKSFIAPNGQRIDVLRGVTFTAENGESIAITGASGSGKSTLLHLLGGLETADHGTIDFDHNSPGIGFIFQFHYLLPDLSALENVALPLLIARWKKERAYERARTLLQDSGLGDRTDHPISHLSGGEQQRVAVARALVTQPKLLLADEPTGNLDAAIGEKIGQTLIAYAHNEGAITIIATHSASFTRMCDRSLVLEEGRLK